MAVVGERRTKNLAESYKHNPLHAYAEAFTQTAEAIVNESGCDIYGETNRAMNNKSALNTLKNFFIEGSYDPTLDADTIQEHIEDMEAQFENDREGILEHVSGADMNPVIGMSFPLHKLILMNMVFDKGAIPKVVAQRPKFTLSMEYRILVDTEGNEIDMFKQQNKIAEAVHKTAPLIDFEVDLPLTDDQEIVHEKLGGLAGVDQLSIETKVCAVLVKDVYFEEGDILPNENGYVEMGGELATEAGNHDVWVRVNMPFTPTYGDIERALMRNFSYEHKVLDGTDVKVVVTKDVISGTMHKSRLNIASLHGVISSVRVRSSLDPSNARATTCSVKWKTIDEIVEIPNAIPINTTVSPEEVKDIGALYNVNQVTKVMSMMKTVLCEVKDSDIKRHLDESYLALDPDSKFFGQFDYAPRAGYALDHEEWRYKTFLPWFDSYVTKMLQVLNDPNMVITVFGAPDLVRRITPTDYTYQTPGNIGPVELDYTKTVVTSDKRVYQFIGSDKMRGSSELIIVLCPRGTDRIVYRIYDYQLYVSNEIRNADNPSLPAIHSFERWKFVEYQPVQGRINILNPSGIKEDTYDYFPVKQV